MHALSINFTALAYVYATHLNNVIDIHNNHRPDLRLIASRCLINWILKASKISDVINEPVAMNVQRTEARDFQIVTTVSQIPSPVNNAYK